MNDKISSASFVSQEQDGQHSLNILVDGMHCPSCVALIENALHEQAPITNARLNLSTKRLKIIWNGDVSQGDEWIQLINKMGYSAAPFDPATSETSDKRKEKFLLRCLAIAGFASGNLMLFSVPIWSSDSIEMGDATRTFFHWIQAAIAIPAIAYCGMPFYRSAWAALKECHTNMDVPISIAVILAAMMSLFETITYGSHTYFDSAVMLLFFLLIGRYLEARARGKARASAHNLLKMMTGYATWLKADGTRETIAMQDIQQEMILLVAAGEKISADGEIIHGNSDIDTSLITGESLPRTTHVGDTVFAGTVNLSAPIQVRVTKAHERSLIAEIIKLMETAEQSQAQYVTLADRISGWYTPSVFALATATFIGWISLGQAIWQDALLHATTVLIITCPCALGLAVPVVQVLASGRLLKSGILLKSGNALEKLASISHAVFDKTGTLTIGKPELILPLSEEAQQALPLAASMASHSKHPLSQALSNQYQHDVTMLEVTEVQGCGLETSYQGKQVKLGKRSWCTDHQSDNDNVLELWLSVEGQKPVRYMFADPLRSDASHVIKRLQQKHIQTLLLSGDRKIMAQTIAEKVGINAYEGDVSPIEKTNRINTLKDQGHRVLMVGDGLNDAPSLVTADISMSPTSAIDITQNAADIVFQGNQLQPVLTAWRVAYFSQTLVKQNFLLAIAYNIIAIPLAVTGYVTPLIAAITMSGSSLMVISNAMRLNLLKETS